jgi:hypothetical protein
MTYQWVQFVRFTNLILLIVLAIVASTSQHRFDGGLERTREFGIMLALGTNPSNHNLVALESFAGTVGRFRPGVSAWPRDLAESG